MSETRFSVAYLGLGSNVEPRRKYLQEALQALATHPNIQIAARSAIYTSQSVEGGGDCDFLNAVVRIETGLSPRELLGIVQKIETQMGRAVAKNGEHRGGPRTLDIDILLFDDLQMNERDLQLPHPRLGYRAFVLRPLLEVLQGGWVRESVEQWD